jgi:diguanylate cyclase (GGDEF)-like protein/PAS domain S-box-containing protein
MAIGLTGLVGYVLAPDLLFGWARSARMAIHTAIGMVLASVGLWQAFSRKRWYTTGTFVGEGTQIRVLGGAILFVVTVTAGLSGFVLLQRSFEGSIEAQLTTITTSRPAWLHEFAEQVLANAKGSARVAGFLSSDFGGSIQVTEARPEDAARRLLAMGYRGVALVGRDDRAVTRFGRFEDLPAIDAPLDVADASSLVWDQGFVLRSRIPLPDDGHSHYAAVELDLAVPDLGRLMFNTGRLGPSTEVVACVQSSQRELICAPDVANPKPFRVSTHLAPADPLPMQRALRGESGIVYTFDYHGRNVIAAYGLLAPGLGLVAKQQTVEAYAPIRAALGIGAPTILALALLGAFALHSQVSPLLRRMHRSEQLAAQTATQMRTVMDAVGDGLLTIDVAGTIRSANPAAHQIFGYESGQLLGRDVATLMPASLRDAHRAGMARFRAGGEPRVLGRRDMQLAGLRLDGTEFPMELSIDVVPHAEETLFVGALRDITARKQVEEKLSRMAEFDSLTGLPNRALFMDRLSTALIRAARSKRAVAVMFIDLDGFKAVNDTHGHAAGDELLKEVARRLEAAVRKSDTVARLAGDEFTVILEELINPAVDAQRLATKLVETLRRPVVSGDIALRVTASIGLVVHDPELKPDIDAAQLLREADGAMYAAKRAGKDAVVRFELDAPVTRIAH